MTLKLHHMNTADFLRDTTVVIQVRPDFLATNIPHVKRCVNKTRCVERFPQVLSIFASGVATPVTYRWWKMITLPIFHYLTYRFVFKRLGECTFWTLQTGNRSRCPSEGVGLSCTHRMTSCTRPLSPWRSVFTWSGCTYGTKLPSKVWRTSAREKSNGAEQLTIHLLMFSCTLPCSRLAALETPWRSLMFFVAFIFNPTTSSPLIYCKLYWRTFIWLLSGLITILSPN